MRKITIFGSYNGSSIGDTAILLGMLCSLERIYGDDVLVDVLVMKEIGLIDEVRKINLKINVNEIVISRYRATSGFIGKAILLLRRIQLKLFPETIIDHKKVAFSLSDSEHLLIGGGNLIMDLFPRWPALLKKICSESNKLNVRYSIVGVGAGPINSENGFSILKQCLVGSYKIYFRDNQSKRYCMDMLGFDGGFLMPDFALGINPVPSKKKNHAKKIILFNVADYYGNSWPGKDVVKFKKYIDGMASLALFIRECYLFDELVIFNSNYPSDKQSSLNLFEQLQGSNYRATIRIIEGRKSVGELIQLGQTAEFAFTTRLHAGIIVAHGGCKLIGIAYQPKVKDVLEDAGVTPYVIDIKSILNGAGFESIVRDSLEGLNYNMITNEALKIDNALLSILEN